jgi:nitrite reductase/ring-hydroxylating ferredoxin subunit
MMTNNKNHENYAIAAVCAHDGDAPNSSGLPGEEYEAVATFPVRVHAGKIQVRDERWD